MHFKKCDLKTVAFIELVRKNLPVLVAFLGPQKLKKDVDLEKSLSYVFQAITLTRKKLEGRVPLIGFSGAPVRIINFVVFPTSLLIKVPLYTNI